jgi:hypothetical protein
MHSSILRQIWFNFMAQFLFFRLFYSFHNFSDFNFFGLSTTDETSLVEMRIWCIKIGIVLVLHYNSADYTSLNNTLLNCRWDEEVFNVNDIDDVYSIFQNTNECINCHIPTKLVTIRPKDKVFMTNTIRRLMRKRIRIHYKAVKTNSQLHYMHIGVDTSPYVIKSFVK